MGHNSLNIASLIGSRICHDLISPIGAINNGIELMGMSQPGPMSPEMALIAESCDNAAARIRYFRVAFGSAGSKQRIGAAEIEGILADVLRGGRLRVDWQTAGDQPRSEVQLAFLALMCFETALPYGGDVAIAFRDEHWVITGAAPRMSLNDALWQGLGAAPSDETGAEITPALVQFALLPVLVADFGRKIETQIEESRLTMRI